jgi:selenocysteine lyase/cysteine desulfurase
MNYLLILIVFALSLISLTSVWHARPQLSINRDRWSGKDDIRPDYGGRNSTRQTEGHFTFKPDIGDRFQPGGLPLLLMSLMHDALTNMQRRGLDPQTISQHVLALMDLILRALNRLDQENPQLRLNIAVAEDPQWRGPHVTIRMSKNRAEELCEATARRGVYFSYDNEGLRIGPRFYNGEADTLLGVKILGEVLTETS